MRWVPALFRAKMGAPTQPSPKGADMKEGLIGPTATLAAAILSKVEPLHSEFTEEVIASAFEEAYKALLEGIRRVDEEEQRGRTKAV